jgi:diguanylate cyclase (GGDEF)-like protein/PAS domain S-box-containing protein
MKLSLRISLVIGLLSLAISTIFASFNYHHQLQQVTAQNQLLVQQLSDTAKGTSAIAAYLIDEELGQDVVDGLASNDLIMAATIRTVAQGRDFTSGTSNYAISSINTKLYNPFSPDEIVGTLEVVPNLDYIKSQATGTSLQNAFLLIGLSVIIAIAVGFYVRSELTKPIKKLSNALQAIDTDTPEYMLPIDIAYTQKNEISSLSNKTNILISALKQQFLSERNLRQSTEELQRRFRLLFEQASAGIGLLCSDGKITIANPAMVQLFGKKVDGQDFAQLFDSPGLIKDQIKLLVTATGVSQTDLDIEFTVGQNKRFLHCIFSSINDVRCEIREYSEQLVEVIIYDITHRKKREEKARYEADHDSLTGLLSRRAGLERLSEKLSVQSQQIQDKKQSVLALMMIDLDKFKPINDTYGHDVGDVLLKQVSQRIMSSTIDLSAVNIRWGGDEFLLGMSFTLDVLLDSKKTDKAILCNHYLTESPVIKRQVERLIALISNEVVIDNELSVAVGASIGVVLLPPNKAADIESLIARADELMYVTKKQKATPYAIVNFT